MTDESVADQPRSFDAMSDADLGAYISEGITSFRAAYANVSTATPDEIAAMESQAGDLRAAIAVRDARNSARSAVSDFAESIPDFEDLGSAQADEAPAVEDEPEAEAPAQDEAPAEDEAEAAAEAPEATAEDESEAPAEAEAQDEAEAPGPEADQTPADEADPAEADASTDFNESPEEDNMAAATGDALAAAGGAVVTERESEFSQTPAKILTAMNFGQTQVGSEVTVAQVAENLNRRLMSVSGMGNVSGEFNLATVQGPSSPDLAITSDDPEEAERVLDFASSGKYLPGKRDERGNLTEFAGWCAPATVDYTIPSWLNISNLFPQPSVEVPRGSLQYFQGLCFCDVNLNGFTYTAEQVNASQWGTNAQGVGNDTDGDKPCVEIPCIEPVTAELGILGYCITGSLHTRRSFPELYSRWLTDALAKYQVNLSLKAIADIAAGSTAVTMPSPQVGTYGPIITALDIQARIQRQNLGNANAVLEVIMPIWVRAAIRSDLVRRLGVDLLLVPDARIDALLRQLGLNIQWVDYWQPLSSGATSWPVGFQALMYPRGGWVRGTKNIFSIDALYDSAMLKDNKFTVRFQEEGYTQIKRTCDSRLITIPVCSSGEAGAGIDIACDGRAAEDIPPVQG